MKNFILCMAFSLALGPVAAFSAVSCKSILQVNSDSDVIFTTFNSESVTDAPTVDIVAQEDGLYGGKRLKLVRSGETWVSKYASFTFDLQGDPRWFVGAMGDEAAAFFGFKILNSKEMLIPDVIEFQGALDRVNQRLVEKGLEPVPIKMVKERFKGKPLQGYLDHYINGELPFSFDGMTAIHDLSFHTGTIFIPPTYLKASIQRVKFTMDFLNYLKTKLSEVKTAPSQELLRLLPRVESYVKGLLVRNIDNVTAFGNLTRIAEAAGEQSSISSEVMSLMSRMLDSDVGFEDMNKILTAGFLMGSDSPTPYYKSWDVMYALLDKDPHEIYSLERYVEEMLTQYYTYANMDMGRQIKDIRSYMLIVEDHMTQFLTTELGGMGHSSLEAPLSKTGVEVGVRNGYVLFGPPEKVGVLNQVFSDRFLEVQSATLDLIEQ